MDYIFGIIYIILGLIGGLGHYVKKRYVDNTLDCSLYFYLFNDKKTTIRTTWAIICAEIGLSLLHTSETLGLAELIGALTAGYTADSGINKEKE